MSSEHVSGAGDFDFLIGDWEVANRRLTAPLTGSTEWEEFPATARCSGRLFGGAANLDELTFPTLGFSGLTLRLFEPGADRWTLNWVNSRTGRFSPAVSGRFGPDGTGVFVGDDVYDGRPVLCRFIWSNIDATAARWEQSFSTDGGETWESNWTMHYVRTGSS